MEVSMLATSNDQNRFAAPDMRMLCAGLGRVVWDLLLLRYETGTWQTQKPAMHRYAEVHCSMFGLKR